MKTPLCQKSSLAEIRDRFDHDVERFSNIETGQAATIDAPLAMEMITQAACKVTPNIRKVLDIGCGAGNNSVKLSWHASAFNCDLVDLSRPMLNRARERLEAVNEGRVRIFHGDFREVELEGGYDVIIAAAVLHHLRSDDDWEDAFVKIYQLTAPGGSFWITDLVAHEHTGIQSIMWSRYANYLEATGGEEYRDRVLNCIEKEDSPRPVTYQLDLLRKVGFDHVDLLHKNACFAAYGAVRMS